MAGVVARSEVGRFLRWPVAGALAVLVGVLLVFAETAPFARAAGDTIDAHQLLQDLRTLSSDAMQGRELGTAGGARARQFVIDRFRASGVAPFGRDYLQAFTFMPGGGRAADTRQGANVIGQIAGTADPAHYIVVSAHYDHLGIRRGVVYNGADDNASGTAALFAIAAYYHAHPPRHSLLFAAFDGEEEGLIGSHAFVRSPPVDASTLLVDLNADMLGRESQNRLFVSGVATQPALAPFVARVAAHAPVRLIMGHDDPRHGGDDWTRDSDQYSFIQAGIPALYFGVEDYDQHHEPTDDFQTITVDFYIHAVETMVQVVGEFDRSAGDQLKRK